MKCVISFQRVFTFFWSIGISSICEIFYIYLHAFFQRNENEKRFHRTFLWMYCFLFSSLCRSLCRIKIRNSPPEVFCKKGVLRNFAKFTGKHLCESLLFNKVVSLRPATLLKMRLSHWCFPVNFAKFLRTNFLIEHPRWLLL